MVTCTVDGCRNSPRRSAEGVTFHKFPKNAKRRLEWLAALKRVDWQPSRSSIVCSEHFRPEDLDRQSPFRSRVKDNAVPSLFPSPSNVQGECKSSTSIMSEPQLEVDEPEPQPTAMEGVPYVHDFQTCLKRVRVWRKKVSVPDLPESSEQELKISCVMSVPQLVFDEPSNIALELDHEQHQPRETENPNIKELESPTNISSEPKLDVEQPEPQLTAMEGVPYVHDFHTCLKKAKKVTVPGLPETSEKEPVSDQPRKTEKRSHELISAGIPSVVLESPRKMARRHYLHDFLSCLRNGSVPELSGSDDDEVKILVPVQAIKDQVVESAFGKTGGTLYCMREDTPIIEIYEPSDKSIHLMREINTNHPKLFSDLKSDFWEKCGALGWSFQYLPDNIIFRAVENCVVRKTLFVNRSTGTYSISLCGRPLEKSHLLFQNRPSLETKNQLWEMLYELHRWHSCCGTEDPEYVKTWVDNPVKNAYFCNIRNSIFSNNCTMLSFKRKRCAHCKKKRSFLRQRHARWERYKSKALRNIASSNFKGHDYLPRPVLTKRCLEFETKYKKLQWEMDRCKPKLEDLSEKMKWCICGNALSKRAADAENMDADGNELVHLLMREQLKAIKAIKDNSRCTFKWHPAILKFSAYIYKKSPETYKAMRGCGFLHLPDKNALYRILSRPLRKKSDCTNLDDFAHLFDNSDDSSNTQSDCEIGELGNVTDDQGSNEDCEAVRCEELRRVGDDHDCEPVRHKELGNMGDNHGSDRQESVPSECEQNEEDCENDTYGQNTSDDHESDEQDTSDDCENQEQ